MANAHEAQIDFTGAFKKYTDEVKDSIFKAEKRIAKQMLTDIIKSSPVRKPYENKTARGAGYAAYVRERRGRYQRGWQLKSEKKKNGNTLIETVYNKTDAPLAHLIDLGHDSKNNGKHVEGTEHIRKAQKKARKELEETIKNILK